MRLHRFVVEPTLLPSGERIVSFKYKYLTSITMKKNVTLNNASTEALQQLIKTGTALNYAQLRRTYYPCHTSLHLPNIIYPTMLRRTFVRCFRAVDIHPLLNAIRVSLPAATNLSPLSSFPSSPQYNLPNDASTDIRPLFSRGGYSSTVKCSSCFINLYGLLKV